MGLSSHMFLFIYLFFAISLFSAFSYHRQIPGLFSFYIHASCSFIIFLATQLFNLSCFPSCHEHFILLSTNFFSQIIPSLMMSRWGKNKNIGWEIQLKIKLLVQSGNRANRFCLGLLFNLLTFSSVSQACLH